MSHDWRGAPHVVAYGGGVQSNALMVLAKRGLIPHQTFLFANVGEDSEYPPTLTYYRDLAVPYANEHGIDLIELWFERKRAGRQTLWQRMFKDGGAAVTIPAFLPSGNPTERACTADHKVGVMNTWLTAHGASADTPAVVALGFSTDEVERCKPSRDPETVKEWPLIKGYGLSMNRQDCINLIRDEGLPVPPKSSCFFCPWHSVDSWRELKRNHPDLFQKSQELEDRMIAGRVAHGNDVPVFLTRYGRRLSEVIDEQGDQGVMFESDPADAEGQCDEAGCFT